MNIMITGAGGFIGRNLIATLQTTGNDTLFPIEAETDEQTFLHAVQAADFVIHLAGVNRPPEPGDFDTGNRGLTEALLQALMARERPAPPVLLSSSTQAALDNPYGRSKRAAEQLVLAYGEATGAPVYVYRLTNVFGKWSRPFYNSAVATFCHQAAHGLPITVNDPKTALSLVYIDDVVAAFAQAAQGQITPGMCEATPVYGATLDRIEALLRGFSAGRADVSVPDMGDAFTRKLYATYLSFLPESGLSYPLAMHADERGSFTEFLRTPDRGQVSVNISNPGITKGNHWHHSKHEKFLVVRGEGVIRLRRLGEATVLSYPVRGEALEVVEIPPGYTHSIENTGQGQMVTVMWASEPFDPQRPDTFFEEV